MSKKYRKKPVEIEAIQWTGDNKEEIRSFFDDSDLGSPNDVIVRGTRVTLTGDGELFIHTLEGTLEADKSDYIVKGVEGEFYPVKPRIFHQTYEEV